MAPTYEIRTIRNARVFAYESLHQAKEALKEHEKRVGVRMKITKITLLEEDLDA